MNPTETLKIATSVCALLAAMPASAQEQQDEQTQQDDVQLLSSWNYDPLYAEGWSVENMFDMTEVVDANGEDIGDIENVIFSNDGEVLGVIAQVGGFWDILDTHVHVPWDEVTLEAGIQRMRIPVTEETVDDYDVFGDYAFDEQIIAEADTDVTQQVDDDLVAGAGIFKATDLMGDYIFLPDGERYGYVTDLIVQDGSVSAVVTDAAAYGRRGYYAYPYNEGMGWTRRTTSPYYAMPYDAAEIDTLETFDYERLQSRVTP